jgi:hypothetical protein
MLLRKIKTRTCGETRSYMVLKPVVFDVEPCSMGQPAWKNYLFQDVSIETMVISHQRTDILVIKEQKILDSLKKQMILEHRILECQEF